jgi:uncharacterized lipoprotein YddW (UPF0748 family)
MTRRQFLRLTALGAVASAHEFSFAQSPAKFILSAPLTHSDWMLKAGIAWGPEGVRHMLDQCKECGWTRVHWRVLDGGRALYKSKLLRPMGKWDEDSFWNPQTEADKAIFRRFTSNMSEDRRLAMLKKFEAFDYANFDPLTEAVRYGHQIGLQIHAWVSINEDDHGWGLQSDFSKIHPAYRWRGRGGKAYHSQLSFAFPEVRRYKLSILKELLANYPIDGLFLDWVRTGDVRDNPQNDPEGVANYGYENPLVNRCKKKFGKNAEEIPNRDEAWVRLRAEPQTEFMREVRKLVARQKRVMPIGALVGHPWHYRGEMNKIDGNLRGLLLDVTTWARDGLVDAVVPAGYYRDGGNAEVAAQALRKETERTVDVWTYAWVPSSVADAEQTFATAERVGTKQILFWEADYIDDRVNAVELKKAMKGRASEE